MLTNEINRMTAALPFSIEGTTIDAAIKDANNLIAMSQAALSLYHKVKQDAEDAVKVVEYRVGHEVQMRYCFAMRHLKCADEQQKFLTPDERETVYNTSTRTDDLLGFWKDPEILASDSAILAKYAEAITTEPDFFKNDEADYTPVIEAGNKANTPTPTP
ncbi:MAG: hypothetical protein WCL08_00385 [Verrucomicrobiota bacterium]